MRRAVFLDRDGTIARYTEYCCRPEDLHVLPGAGAAIRRLNEAGLVVVAVTNQSAIARGWLAPETLERIHDKLRRDLARDGARLDAIYVCPHHPDNGCGCRKPAAGLLTRAAEELGLSLAASYMVGDRWLDVLSGRSVGSATILVRSGYRPEPSNGVVPDHDAATLQEAVGWILEQVSHAA